MGNKENPNSDNEVFDYKDVPDLCTDVKQEMLDTENSQPIKPENSREDFIVEHNNFLSEQEGIIVKTKKEPIDCKNAYDVFADSDIKEEELDIKEENMEQNETRSEDFILEYIKILVKIEHSYSLNHEEIDIPEDDFKEELMDQGEIRHNKFLSEQEGVIVKTKEEPIDYKNAHDVFANSEIKEEELDIKEENMEQHETRRENESCQRNITNQFSGNSKYLKDRIFQCDQCVFQTKYRRNLWRHLIRHKKPGEIINIFRCNHCEYRTRHKRHLSTHMRCMHNNLQETDMRYKCNQCDFQTKYKKNLENHFIRHRNPDEMEKFRCDQCNFQTVRKRSLDVHRLRHNNPEFKCDQCDYQTTGKRALNIHLCQHISDEVDMFKCHQYPFQTVYKNSLSYHIFGHKNPKEANRFK